MTAISLEGDDLQVGGHGMNEFYDQILPRYAAKLGAKWGAKVGKSEIKAGKENTQTVHSIDITDPMFESVMSGQALFRPKAELKDDRNITNEDEAVAAADAGYEKLLPGHGHVYVNGTAASLIASVFDEPVSWGAALTPSQAEYLTAGLKTLLRSHYAPAAQKLLTAIQTAGR